MGQRDSTSAITNGDAASIIGGGSVAAIDQLKRNLGKHKKYKDGGSDLGLGNRNLGETKRYGRFGKFRKEPVPGVPRVSAATEPHVRIESRRER